MASPSPSPLLASLRRAADAAWVASGGPLVDEATAAMAEAHSLQLCLLGLQHEISEMSTGAAEPTPSCGSVEAKAEAEAEAEVEAEAGDGPVASQLFEGHQVLDGGGFRTLQHAFATQEECAQVPCTRHALTMRTAVRTPCSHLATRRVRAGARGGNVGHGPELSSRRPDDLVHHTRAAREAGRMRCLFGRAVSRGGDGAGADRCAARARRWRPLPVRLAPHTTRPPARGLARGAVGWHGPSAVLRVPPLTALTARGCLSRAVAAWPTRDGRRHTRCGLVLAGAAGPWRRASRTGARTSTSTTWPGTTSPRCST